MRKKYGLAIYPPDAPDGYQCFVIESDEPFLTFQRGDLINPRNWNKHWAGIKELYRDKFEYPILLKVVNIEHLIQQAEDESMVQHLIYIFTTGVEDTESSRM